MRKRAETTDCDQRNALFDEHYFKILLVLLCRFCIFAKNKQQNQIKKDGKSFVVKDDIEFGYLNVIPLWAFGLNY